MHGLPHLHHADEYDPHRLTEAKLRLGATVSVCLPARNEHATVGAIARTIRSELIERVPLVDELIVMDDGSTDPAAAVAAGAGALVVATDDVLPEAGPGSGKGNVLWKSLYASTGDLIVWVDADIRP